jgi:uncharacterized membrane protein
MPSSGWSAPAKCECGYSFIVDDPSRHPNTVSQHVQSASHKQRMNAKASSGILGFKSTSYKIQAKVATSQAPGVLEYVPSPAPDVLAASAAAAPTAAADMRIAVDADIPGASAAAASSTVAEASFPVALPTACPGVSLVTRFKWPTPFALNFPWGRLDEAQFRSLLSAAMEYSMSGHVLVSELPGRVSDEAQFRSIVVRSAIPIYDTR